MTPQQDPTGRGPDRGDRMATRFFAGGPSLRVVAAIVVAALVLGPLGLAVFNVFGR